MFVKSLYLPLLFIFTKISATCGFIILENNFSINTIYTFCIVLLLNSIVIMSQGLNPGKAIAEIKKMLVTA